MPADRACSWTVEAIGYDPADEGRREALFALGNGVFVVRAATVHAAGSGRYAGTYRAGGYDRVVGCIEGEADPSDTLVNLPDWLPLDLRTGAGDWFRLDQADLLDYRHALDLRTGTAVRAFTFRDPRAAAQALLAQAPGYAALRMAHVRAWRQLWARMPLHAQDARTERDLRLHALHVLQTLSPHTAGLDVGVPARGWHGEAYRGHVFWDDLLDELPADARDGLLRRLGLTADELARWDTVSRGLFVPCLADGVLAQFEGFDRLRPLDPDLLPPALAQERIDWALQATGRNVNDWQVTKQADALTAFHLLGERTTVAVLERLGYRFGRPDLLRTARYYLDRTTHRSSLSRIVYAGALAQADPQLSWTLFRHALGTDLHVLPGESVAEGIHLAAMGGTLDVLQRHYLGLAPQRQGLRLEPALPPEFGPLRLSLHHRGQRLVAESDGQCVRLCSSPRNGAAVPVLLGEQRRMLEPGAALESSGHQL
jgi:trehalose/maltose hydrolase-like predicted phosphorylase